MPSIQQWFSMWDRYSEPESSRLILLYEQLIARYRSEERRYHNESHIDECLSCFLDVYNEAEHPEEIEFALWFHDAIYDTKRKDNELRSAEWAQSEALAFGISGEVADRISHLILSTKHAIAPTTCDAKILVDIDLAILGSDRNRFDLYESQIREEYSWVPWFIYRRKRRQILNEFLARSSIYSTATVYNRLEQQARSNLHRSISRL
jgi:predicted metal-dependent HD superfamily phosphohydrolase